MDPEVKKLAMPYEGNIPEDWEFISMTENAFNRFRYYKDKNGKYWFTTQKKKQTYEFSYQTRKDNSGRTFAQRSKKPYRCT